MLSKAGSKCLGSFCDSGFMLFINPQHILSVVILLMIYKIIRKNYIYITYRISFGRFSSKKYIASKIFAFGSYSRVVIS